MFLQAARGAALVSARPQPWRSSDAPPQPISSAHNARRTGAPNGEPMSRIQRQIVWAVGVVVAGSMFSACDSGAKKMSDSTTAAAVGLPDLKQKMAAYTSVTIHSDTTNLTPKERQMLPLLIEAARAMDPIYWQQAYGSRDSLMAAVSDSGIRRFIDINYGPWDRLEDNAPFVTEIGSRPAGANLYPRDMTKEKFEAYRYEMARRVWTSMKETDSRECRNCHGREAMSKDLQSAKAQARHAKGVAEGKTCIDCHFGIAHKEPDGPGPQEMSAATK